MRLCSQLLLKLGGFHDLNMAIILDDSPLISALGLSIKNEHQYSLAELSKAPLSSAFLSLCRWYFEEALSRAKDTPSVAPTLFISQALLSGAGSKEKLDVSIGNVSSSTRNSPASNILSENSNQYWNSSGYEDVHSI